jgi:hypothetical protein
MYRKKLTGPLSKFYAEFFLQKYDQEFCNKKLRKEKPSNASFRNKGIQPTHWGFTSKLLSSCQFNTRTGPSMKQNRYGFLFYAGSYTQSHTDWVGCTGPPFASVTIISLIGKIILLFVIYFTQIQNKKSY